MDKVIVFLKKKHDVERSKDQLRKWWSDLKHREKEQLVQIQKTIKKSK